MVKQKVVVTGMSVCAPNGIGVEQFEKNTLKGVSGCQKVDFFDIPDHYSQVAGVINDFYPEGLFDFDRPQKIHRTFRDRQQLIAEFCMHEAMSMARLNSVASRKSMAVDLCLASAIGPMMSMEYAFIAKNVQKQELYPVHYQKFSFRDMSQRLASVFNLKGMDIVVPTGCVGGCDAIAYGAQMIRSGKSECMIVGAVEAPITPLVVTAFGQINATSTRACDPTEASRPFDSQRDGFVLGEGGGLLVLESEQSALARGAQILGEIKGFGSTNNCYHMTDLAAHGEHIAKSCEQALRDAELTADDIDYINAHGSSTEQNDIAEASAFKQIFGERVNSIPATSIKSQTGHALSAASAIEAVSSIQTLHSHKIPMTLNLQKQDPRCGLNIVTNEPESRRVNNIIKTSSGFSGIHTSLVIGSYGAGL